MKTVSKMLVLLGAVALVSCDVYYEEGFKDGKWLKDNGYLG